MISSQKHTSDTTELVETKHHKFHVKDPGSALTHFIAMIGAVIAAVSPARRRRYVPRATGAFSAMVKRFCCMAYSAWIVDTASVVSSSTSSSTRTVSSEVKTVTPFSTAQRRIAAPSCAWTLEWMERVLMM